MLELPNLRGRFFNVPLCCDCWDRLNPERKLDPARRAELDAQVAKATEGWDKDQVADNRCAACDENVHAGIFVRVNVASLRAMRPR